MCGDFFSFPRQSLSLSLSFSLSPGTFAVVELMIGNAIDKTLASLGRDDCLRIEDSMGDPGVNASANQTMLLNECDQLKVEMAVTLAFLTGIIMVLTLSAVYSVYLFF